MVTVTRNQTQGVLAPYVRVGVGGRWTVEELQRSLISFLGSTGWQVLTRPVEGVPNASASGSTNEILQDDTPLAGLVELVPLGDGLSQVVGFPESEELDAVVISPLAESGAEGNGMTARRYLARFVRQLRPGGATIFAADDPVSDIFSAIRLDCRRLSYASESETPAWREGGERDATGRDENAFDSTDRTRLELAAMAVVQAFGIGVKDTSGTIGVLAS